MSYICWFTDPHAADSALAGGKGANLSRLTAGGFPIPPGFCITADAYSYLLEVTGLNQVINRLLDEINFDDHEDIAGRSAVIRDLIEQQPIPEEIAAAILRAYADLGRALACRHLEATPVAVRSSATAEDLPEASFAGQQDTYLNIRGGHSLLEHVRRCWASLWTSRAMTYRQRHGFEHQKVAVAVVVQAMVNPAVSGILFTANPITGSRSECVINASWGLGEAIVSGLVNPDTLIVDKSSGQILQQDIVQKERKIVFSSRAGAVEEDVPEQQQRQNALRPSQAAHLTALAVRIEEYFGAPQDIEWALESGSCYILQARPITTLGTLPDVDDGAYSRAMFVEIFPDGLSPAFLSVVCPLLAAMLQASFSELGFKDLPDAAAVRAIRGQPYISIDYIEEVLQDLEPAERRHLQAKFSNIFAPDEDQPRLSITELRMAWRLFRFVRRFRRQVPALLAAYRRQIDKINTLPLAPADDRMLLTQTRQICYEGAGPLLNNDFLLIAALGAHRTFLRRLLERPLGPQTDELLSSLLSGVSGNVVMESNKLIWDLAQQARRDPQVLRILREQDPQQALVQLRALPGEQPFLRQLQALLDVCGHREQYFDICYPTWVEDPSPVIAFVQSYLAVEPAAGPLQRAAELLTRREAAAARVHEALGRTWPDRLLRRPLFNYLLDQTQWLLRQRDTMHYEWTRLFPPVRRIQLELGRRWRRRQLIDDETDIFFLELGEQERLADTPAPCQVVVGERRAAYSAYFAGPWPTLITGGNARKEPSRPLQRDDPAVLTGIAGSPGVAAGPARIISGPADFSRLQPGDILVAPATNPAWTPLFAVAGGIVTEAGGLLSHGAIVAREYGIPAVMSLSSATTLLAGEDRIIVDGDRGQVIREGAAPSLRTDSRKVTEKRHTRAQLFH